MLDIVEISFAGETSTLVQIGGKKSSSENLSFES